MEDMTMTNVFAEPSSKTQAFVSERVKLLGSQLLISAHVLVLVSFWGHSPSGTNSVHLQFGRQVVSVQVWFVEGFPVKTPQLFKSVTFLVCVPFVHDDHEV